MSSRDTYAVFSCASGSVKIKPKNTEALHRTQGALMLKSADTAVMVAPHGGGTQKKKTVVGFVHTAPDWTCQAVIYVPSSAQVVLLSQMISLISPPTG